MQARILDANHARKNPKYAIICVLCHGKWLMVRHRDRQVFETPGGHIEPGETMDAAAIRELYEETGIRGVPLTKVCDYFAEDEQGGAWGGVYLAIIDTLPAHNTDFEIIERKFFDTLPEDDMYHEISHVVYKAVQFFLYTYGWVLGDQEMILSPMTHDVVICEHNGQEAHGHEEVSRWIENWLPRGHVSLFDIIWVSIDCLKNTLFAQWHFACTYDGEDHAFDGASLVQFTSENKISRIDEYHQNIDIHRPFVQCKEEK